MLLNFLIQHVSSSVHEDRTAIFSPVWNLSPLALLLFDFLREKGSSRNFVLALFSGVFLQTFEHCKVCFDLAL